MSDDMLVSQDGDGRGHACHEAAHDGLVVRI
jgi:hypothetical protein